MDRSQRWIAVAALAAVAAFGRGALAQVARSGGSANAELVNQLQQLASDRTALQAENARLKSQLADVTKDRDALKAGQQGLDRRARDTAAALAQSNGQRDRADQELTQYQAKMQELIAKFRETIQKLRDTETESASAKQSLATRERELSVCVDRNVALYHLNQEVLNHMDRQGFWSRLAQNEPFTQIKRVQNENLIDNYRARAQDQRVAPSTAPPAGSTPTAH